MQRKGQYTPEEKEYLLRNEGVLTVKVMAETLGRSNKSVYTFLSDQKNPRYRKDDPNIGTDVGLMALYYSAITGALPEVSLLKVAGLKMMPKEQLYEDVLDLEDFTGVEKSEMCGLKNGYWHKQATYIKKKRRANA